MRSKVIVQLLNVQKTFHPSGVKALRGANLSLEVGSIHALLGANGAGKTTLVRILAGELQPDVGKILVDGKVVDFRTPKDAMKEKARHSLRTEGSLEGSFEFGRFDLGECHSECVPRKTLRKIRTLELGPSEALHSRHVERFRGEDCLGRTTR
jgi:ABC-type hemin transport system ATPase subunit